MMKTKVDNNKPTPTGFEGGQKPENNPGGAASGDPIQGRDMGNGAFGAISPGSRINKATSSKGALERGKYLLARAQKAQKEWPSYAEGLKKGQSLKEIGDSNGDSKSGNPEARLRTYGPSAEETLLAFQDSKEKDNKERGA